MDTQPVLLSPADQAEIIESLVEKITALYVFPDLAEQICSNLKQHAENGDYATIQEGELFALALTLNLQEVNHDEHLWVRWQAEPLPADADALRASPDWQEQRRVEARLENYGLPKVERLAGNVGYLEIQYFHRPAWGSETAAAAMNFLANTHALIIDLRKCTGGYPGMIALILSYLFGEEPIHLSSIYWRDEDITQQFWSLPYIPGKRYGNKPVYVLTSKVTFSGGEEFASILQTRRRAIVLGDQTDGGAHPGASYRIHPHFEAFIPIGRSIDPLTGKDFEGVGVIPDISLAQEHAFQAAYALALKAVLASLGKAPSEPYQALAKEAQGALRDLASQHTICPRCGYPNHRDFVQCKNCAEPLTIPTA